uniref:WW domain-containing oxidoreductase n=1 Tax=Anopheles culicifacies TaxID=139723 RepID=A0A182LSD7_9DIPT
MPALMPESDSEDELPPAWEERATSDGFVYYVNHQSKSTQWTHPRTGKMKRVSGELPLGWTRHIEEDTRKVIFVEEKTQRKSYTDPRLAFAVEEAPEQVGELRQRFDSGTNALQVLHGRDLNGKVALITGANTGIGFETARSLALHGCEVIFACRDEKATMAAIEKIRLEKEAAGQRCSYVSLDLGSLRSTKRAAEEVKKRHKHVDMLILNAGVFALPHSITEDGFERTFQVNHLAHFYLTTLLSDLYDHATRIVVVSSESHRMSTLPAGGGLSESDLCPPQHKFWSMIAYNNSKLCNVLFAMELAKQQRDAIDHRLRAELFLFVECTDEPNRTEGSPSDAIRSFIELHLHLLRLFRRLFALFRALVVFFLHLAVRFAFLVVLLELNLTLRD